MNLLPTVNFLGKNITRMIVGDNPQGGFSYIPDRITGDEMKAFHTPEMLLEQLFAIQDAGYNAIMPLATQEHLEILKKFRKMGGKLEIIFQPNGRLPLKENLPQMLELEPFGIYHQGGTTDEMLDKGQEKELYENLELLKNSGVKFGFGSHVPATILRAETENWGADFYVFSMYNLRVKHTPGPDCYITGNTQSHYVFRKDDRLDAYKVIQQVKKPVIAYKIFAGGQIFEGHKPEEYPAVAETFVRETYQNIKPGDITCVGTFQRDSDQISEDAAIARRVLA